MVEESVGEVVRVPCSRRPLTAAARPAVAAGSPWSAPRPGADQVIFDSRQRAETPGRVGAEQGEQLAGGGGITEIVGGTGGQRPSPPKGFGAHPESTGMRERPAGMPQRVRHLPAGGGSEPSARWTIAW